MSRKRGADREPRVGDVLMLGVASQPSDTFFLVRVTATGEMAKQHWSSATWVADHLGTMFGVPNKWHGPWYGPDDKSWTCVLNLGPEFEVVGR
jgi:hypothetical protein